MQSSQSQALPPMQEILHPQNIRTSSQEQELLHLQQVNHLSHDHISHQHSSHMQHDQETIDLNEIGELHPSKGHLIHHDLQQFQEDKINQIQEINTETESNVPMKQSTNNLLEERVTAIENVLKFRCDSMSKEIKFILAELNVITEWISSRFEMELINKKSSFYKSFHKDLDQVEEISKSLSLLSKIPIKDMISNSSSNSRKKSASSRNNYTRNNLRSGSRYKKSQTSQPKNVFKGVLGTWIDSSGCTRKEVGFFPLGVEDIKEEQDDFLNHDPFEDGYIPEVDEEGNNMHSDTQEQIPEGSRPKRSSTRNVSYDGFLESEDDEPPKRVRGSQRKKREKTASSHNEETFEETNDSKNKGTKKKYKPSEASAMRAKILANTPMMCDECGKVVKGPWTLKAHKEMHANIRRYTCHVCGYAFRRKPHLNAHLLLHEGVKHLKCQYCGRGFYLRRDLARHERTHTGEKPYNCTFPNCPKSFNVKQHLTMHYRTHTGERPYKCSVCEKSFSQANTLRIHKKLHEGGNATVTRRKPRTNKAATMTTSAVVSNLNQPQNPIVHAITSSCPTTSIPIQSTSASVSCENSVSSAISLVEAIHPSSTCSTPIPPPSSASSQNDFRSPPPQESHLQQSHSPFPDSRQALQNIPPNTGHPFDMINHSWRQGIGQQSVIGNPTGLFLPQMYEPLNMHYGSYPPNNN